MITLLLTNGLPDRTSLSTLGQEASRSLSTGGQIGFVRCRNPLTRVCRSTEAAASFSEPGDAVHRPRMQGITMAQIAKTAGVSKPLLHPYFPSKISLSRPPSPNTRTSSGSCSTRLPATPPAEQLTHALDAYLEWIDSTSETHPEHDGPA